MLDNTVTLSVDAANDSNPASEVYTRYEEGANRTVYIGSDHTLQSRNTMTVSRSFPKVSGNFAGVAKTTLKFTQDIEVEGVDTTTLNTSPELAAISFSLPVGFTAAEAMHLRQRMVAALDMDAFISLLHEGLQI